MYMREGGKFEAYPSTCKRQLYLHSACIQQAGRQAGKKAAKKAAKLTVIPPFLIVFII